MANIWPSWNSLLNSARRSMRRYSSSVRGEAGRLAIYSIMARGDRGNPPSEGLSQNQLVDAVGRLPLPAQPLVCGLSDCVSDLSRKHEPRRTHSPPILLNRLEQRGPDSVSPR